MSTPAIIMICLMIFGLFVGALRHGKTDVVNFHIKIVDAIIMAALLYWGGFFS